jgi:hypothetical protein
MGMCPEARWQGEGQRDGMSQTAFSTFYFQITAVIAVFPFLHPYAVLSALYTLTPAPVRNQRLRDGV